MSEDREDTKIQGSVILDSNILQYLNNSDIAPSLLIYLNEVITTGYDLTISDITYFDLLPGIPRSKEKQLSETLDAFRKFPVTQSVCTASGQLCTIYRSEKSEFDHIEVPDKIIAATAVLTNSLILTVNSNDYPRPFFNEVHKKLIYYKRKDKENMLCIYLLRPDVEHIMFRFNNRS